MFFSDRMMAMADRNSFGSSFWRDAHDQHGADRTRDGVKPHRQRDAQPRRAWHA